jgi:hypothetical protein
MNGPDISRRLRMKKYEEVGVQLWAAVKLPTRQGLLLGYIPVRL